MVNKVYTRIIGSCLLSFLVGLCIKPSAQIAEDAFPGVLIGVLYITFTGSILKYPDGKLFSFLVIASITVGMILSGFFGFLLFRILS